MRQMLGHCGIAWADPMLGQKREEHEKGTYAARLARRSDPVSGLGGTCGNRWRNEPNRWNVRRY